MNCWRKPVATPQRLCHWVFLSFPQEIEGRRHGALPLWQWGERWFCRPLGEWLKVLPFKTTTTWLFHLCIEYSNRVFELWVVIIHLLFAFSYCNDFCYCMYRPFLPTNNDTLFTPATCYRSCLTTSNNLLSPMILEFSWPLCNFPFVLEVLGWE